MVISYLKIPENQYREELETAWLRGYKTAELDAEIAFGEVQNLDSMAADYAERVVGGSTRPKRPEVGR